MVLTKTTSNLKRPETTYNEHETRYNDLQRAKNDLKSPTASKKGPEMTQNELDTIYNDLNIPTTSKEKTRNDQQQADFQIILQYGANSSLIEHVFHPTFG